MYATCDHSGGYCPYCRVLHRCPACRGAKTPCKCLNGKVNSWACGQVGCIPVTAEDFSKYGTVPNCMLLAAAMRLSDEGGRYVGPPQVPGV